MTRPVAELMVEAMAAEGTPVRVMPGGGACPHGNNMFRCDIRCAGCGHGCLTHWNTQCHACNCDAWVEK